MDFQTAMALSQALSKKVDAASETLNKFPSLPNGLTPDYVRAKPEWKAAKQTFNVAFKMLQDINSYIGKNYKKERSEYYQAKREAQLKENQELQAAIKELETLPMFKQQAN